MKVTDYIIEYLISKDITDIFGYPGGVICHFIDSVTKYSEHINAHCNYHEQASAFAACGYAQESNKIGVAYATSGPGATNLITGIANAYFDSIPTIFFTGQVDTYGLKENLPIRQKGFQETDIVSMVNSVTKYAVRVDSPQDICYELEKSFFYATSGNPGPVLIDLPADIQRAEVEINDLKHFEINFEEYDVQDALGIIKKALETHKRPCLLIGNGIKQAGLVKDIRKIIDKINIPTVFSMPAFDVLPYNHKMNFGFIGANGQRYGNFVLGKSDLIICVGSRLDLKQVGNNREKFAPNAQIIRVDIDKGELEYQVHSDEIAICCDLKQLLPRWKQEVESMNVVSSEWGCMLEKIRDRLKGYDEQEYTHLLRVFGRELPDDISITVDVGQSEVWIAQELEIKEKQIVHMSAGHGAMGYSLPAAIGTYYGNNRPVYSFNGDGGVQMNIQELQYLVREQLPITVVIINNYALGMIRGFQEANFGGNYVHTIEGKGYSVPNFSKIASAYGLQYLLITKEEDVCKLKEIDVNKPAVVEISIATETLLMPNFGQNGLIQDQRPYLERKLFDDLMQL